MTTTYTPGADAARLARIRSNRARRVARCCAEALIAALADPVDDCRVGARRNAQLRRLIRAELRLRGYRRLMRLAM